MNPTILAIDTSTDACSVALLHKQQQFFQHEVMPRAHNKIIMRMINQLFTAANIQCSDLDAIAFGQGPGSFTGLRMSAGIAQGMAFGANIPVIPVSTLQLLAQTAYHKYGFMHVAVAMDARADEIYFNTFSLNQASCMHSSTNDKILSPQAVTLDPTVAWHSVGGGWQIYNDHFSAKTNVSLQHGTPILYPEALSLLTLAEQKQLNKEVLPADKAYPDYIRGDDRWKKQPKV